MAESGKRVKGRSNSSSQQPLYIRNKGQQDNSSSRVDKHGDGHKHQQPRPRHNTNNPKAPSASAIRTSVDVRRHIDVRRNNDVNKEDHFHSRQSAVSKLVDIKEEEDEPTVRTQSKHQSAAHGMDSKQSHAEKQLKVEVKEEDGLVETQRIKYEQCEDQNNQQDAADKPSSSSPSHRHQSWSSTLNKTDQTHDHRYNYDIESTTKSSRNASHHDQKRSHTSEKHNSHDRRRDHSDQSRRKHCTHCNRNTSKDHHHHKKSKKYRKRSSSRKHDDAKNKEKAHGEEKNTSDERHDEEQKTSNSNSASDTTATISTDETSKMYVNNPFSASLPADVWPGTNAQQYQDCDSFDTPNRRRYSSIDKKKCDHKYKFKDKRRSHSHSGRFQEHYQKDDNMSEFLHSHEVANIRKRRRSSNRSQEAETTPSVMENDGYHLAKIQKFENGNENGMASPAIMSSVTEQAAPEDIYEMNYMKEENDWLFGNGVIAASHTSDHESDDEYMFLHGFEDDEQPVISYYNIDPLVTSPLIQSPDEVVKIGYATEFKDLYNFDDYDYSNTNVYLEAGSARSRTSNNTSGSINANDNNYDYANNDDDEDDDNKQNYTQEHDRGGGDRSFQSSSEPSPYKDKTESDLYYTSEHHNHNHHYNNHHSNEMLLKNEIWGNMHSSEDYKPNIAAAEQPDHVIDIDDDTASSKSDIREDLDTSMTKEDDEYFPVRGNYLNYQRKSPDWPKPSPNLSEFLGRMNKPISPRPLENECRSNITQSPDLTGNLTREEYTRRFYESINPCRKRRHSSISTFFEYNRSPDDLSLNQHNVYNAPQSDMSPSTDYLINKRIERRRSTVSSLNSLNTVRFPDDFGRIRLSDPPTFTSEGNANDNEFATPMRIVTPSEVGTEYRRSTDESEPRSVIATDQTEHTEQSNMDENVDTKFDNIIPSSSSAAIDEGSGVFVTPEVSSLTKKSSKRRRSMAVGGQIGKNKQHLLSAKDDFFKKPFEYGWRRELVWRSNLDSTSKADVYFIAPSGKKLRSRSDIAPLLEGDLTVDHFCFIREAQDVGLKHETVRNAKSSRRASTTNTNESSASLQTPSFPVIMGKRVSKPKAPKGASPPPEGWTPSRALRSNNAALNQRLSPNASPGGASIGRASSALRVSNNNFITNTSNNTSNSIIKQECKSMNVVQQTTIANGFFANAKEKSAVTALPQSQPQPQPVLINDSISTIQTVKSITIKPPETTSKELQGNIAAPLAMTVAENTENISESKRKDEETQALLASIDCNKCQSRMKGKLLSEITDPARRCKQCRKRMNNILNVKILSKEEAVANAANIKSSQEIVVVQSKKYISLSRPKQEEPKPIEMSTSIQPRIQKLFDSLSLIKQKKNSSTADISIDVETNTSPINFCPRAVANDTDTAAASISISANQSTTNDDDITDESIATAASTTTTNATGIDSNSKNFNVNELSTPNNNYLAYVCKGYDAILCLMKNLMLPERALLAKTSKLFNAVYNDYRIWQSVNLRNTYILDWPKFTSILQRQNTRVLDMRRIIQKSGHQRNEMWRSFLQNIGSVKSLNTLILPRCPSRVVESVLEYSQELRSLTAFSISDERISLINLDKQRNLRELRLHSSDASDLIGNLETIPMHLMDLTSLSLTNIQNLHDKNIASLFLQRLETLELGDCSKMNATDLVTVLQVMQLRRLRLEFCMRQEETPNNFSVSTLLNGIQTLENLKQLELINVEIKPGFDKELSKCIHLKKLLIIPTYILQSATTNQIIMNAVQQMSSRQLVAFTWGFTIELLRVASLYIDKSKDKRKKYYNIPILCPVPGDIHDKLKYDHNSSATTSAGEHTNSAEQHVAIVPLKKVEDIVRHALPHTKFSTVKVYSASIWKQQLIE